MNFLFVFIPLYGCVHAPALYRKLKKIEKIFIKPPVTLFHRLFFSFIGCAGGDPPGGGDEDVTWTLSADGAGNAEKVGTTSTTKITITFDGNPTGLRNQDIEILGGPATMGSITTPSDNANARVVAVTATGSGNVSIQINRAGIEKGPKSVPVWLKDAKWLIGYIAVADGTKDEVTSTKITFTFDEAVTGLAASNISITSIQGEDGGAAIGDTLSGSGTAYDLKIIVEKQGNVNVAITKDGIYAGGFIVAVYMKEGPPPIPADGQTASLKWRKLTVDPADADPEEQAANAAAGKGNIKGADFTAVMTAAGFQGTYLRVYLDETALIKPGDVAVKKDDGIGALGNIITGGVGSSPESSDNYQIYAEYTTADGGYTYVDMPLKFLKDFINEGNTYIYVNANNGLVIRAILLFEPIPAVPVTALPSGTKEIAISLNAGNPGKGVLGYPYLAMINAAGPGSYLEISASGAPGGDWGIGQIIDSGWGNKYELKTPQDAAEGDDFELKIFVADIKYAFELLDYDEDSKHATGTLPSLGFNIWSTVYFTKILLIEPPNGEDPAPPEPIVIPELLGNLGYYTINGGSDNQKGWASIGTDNTTRGPTITEFKAAKYIVLKVTNMSSRDGLGGLQFTFQGDHDSWAWRNYSDLKGGWTGFANDADDITYLVIDLSLVTDWVSAQSNTSLTQVKLFLGEIQNYGELLGAWLLPASTYTKPTNTVDFGGTNNFGYIVKEADFDWALEGDE